MNIKDQCLKAQNTGTIVRVRCDDREDGWAHGIIVCVGTELFALAVIGNDIRFDGFSCMQFKDVTKIETPDPHHEFIQKALEIKGQECPQFPDFDLSSIRALLDSGEDPFPLANLHVQHKDGENVCYIGKVIMTTDTKVTMWCIDPDANWDQQSSTYPLDIIYRVDYGETYTEALHLVASNS